MHIASITVLHFRVFNSIYMWDCRNSQGTRWQDVGTETKWGDDLLAKNNDESLTCPVLIVGRLEKYHYLFFNCHICLVKQPSFPQSTRSNPGNSARSSQTVQAAWYVQSQLASHPVTSLHTWPKIVIFKPISRHARHFIFSWYNITFTERPCWLGDMAKLN